MSDAPPHPTLTDALPNQVPGIHWPAVVGAREAAVLALLLQRERTQRLSREAPREQQDRQLANWYGYCNPYPERQALAERPGTPHRLRNPDTKTPNREGLGVNPNLTTPLRFSPFFRRLSSVSH